MAGGTWGLQNKVRPGAYINTKAIPQPKPDTTTGRVLLADGAQLDWGASGIVELNSGSDFQALLGLPLKDKKLTTIREALKGAVTVLYLNLNGGDKAKVADAALPWAFTAKNAGTKGNDLTVDVFKDPKNNERLNVRFNFGTKTVDEQVITVGGAQTLKGNSYVDVTFTDTATVAEGDTKKPGQAKLEALQGKTSYKLASGTTKLTEITDVLQNALETSTYNVATTAGYPADSNVHELLAGLVEDLRDNSGYKVSAVVPFGTTDYNHEAVTVVANGVELADGTLLDATQAAAWYAGAASAVPLTNSLTYAEYPEAVDANPRLSNEGTIAALNHGQVVFSTLRDGSVVVEQDINTLTAYTDDKPREFAKNRIIRTLGAIANDTQLAFEKQFIGKINNDATGRDLFKANRVSYLKGLSDAGVIAVFDPTDLTVAPGNDKDAVLVTLGITPNDSMEKLYMTMNVG